MPKSSLGHLGSHSAVDNSKSMTIMNNMVEMVHPVGISFWRSSQLVVKRAEVKLSLRPASYLVIISQIATGM